VPLAGVAAATGVTAAGWFGAAVRVKRPFFPEESLDESLLLTGVAHVGKPPNGVKLISRKALEHGGTTDTAATAEIQAWSKTVPMYSAVAAAFAVSPC